MIGASGPGPVPNPMMQPPAGGVPPVPAGYLPPNMQGPGPSEMQSDEALVVEDDMPLGAKVMRSIYENILNLIEVSTKSLAPVEFTEVKDATTELLDELRGISTSKEAHLLVAS